MIKLFLILFAILFGLIGMKINTIIQPSDPPKLDEPWWGPGSPSEDNTAIKPFKIDVPEDVLIDLKNRLNNKRPFIAPLEKSVHDYGISIQFLEEFVTFWKTKYDWRQREKILNKYPQFKTQIQGLNIHYIHVKPEKTQGVKVVPILLLHGWPGSVKEFYEVIPILTTPQKGRDFVFEVIVASLPGYGFSDPAAKQGLGAVEMAVIFKNLMERLGFEKYYLQGGDWGAIIVQHLSALYGDKVLGVHSNMCNSQTPFSTMKLILGSFYPPAIVDKKYEHKMYPLSNFFNYLLLEFGYFHLQASKPDTIGVTLNDSPAGLAAYILEKFITWTNPEYKNQVDGGLKHYYKYEDLIDNLMIYWVTNSITTSVRLYSESFRISQFAIGMDKVPVKVPAACARFPHEISYTPDIILKDKYYNLIQTTDFDDGGHFAAMQLPKVLAEDIWNAVHKMEIYHNKK